MMRRADRPGSHQRFPSPEQSTSGIDSRCFQRFCGRKGWQDARQAFGKHGLARTRRADHQDIVVTGGRYGERTLGRLLPANVEEVNVVAGLGSEDLRQIHVNRLDGQFVAQEPDRIGEEADRDYVDILDDGGFGCVIGRYDHTASALGGCQHRCRQCALDRPNAPVEGKLADDEIIVDLLSREYPTCDADGDGDWQVEGSGVFLEVGRGEIDRHLRTWPAISAVAERSLDARDGFLNGGLGQTDKLDIAHPATGDVRLNLAGDSVYPLQNRTVHARDHL